MSKSCVKLIHFSDIHLTSRRLGWERQDWFNKRLTGWLNIKLLGRGRRFQLAEPITRKLVDRITTSKADGIIFSGDATKLGFAREYEQVGAVLDPGSAQWPLAVAVPGNHDYYVPSAATSGLFEQLFAPWQQGQRIEGHTYPFVRSVKHVQLIALNAATPNRSNLDASGEIGVEQLERMIKLCEQLPPGLRIVVVHYPMRTATGEVEIKLRRLRDHEAALAAARACRIQLWLHGHIHRPFVRGSCDEIPFGMICSGSATQIKRWSYHEYLIEDTFLSGVRYVYDPVLADFTESERFSMKLRDNTRE